MWVGIAAGRCLATEAHSSARARTNRGAALEKKVSRSMHKVHIVSSLLVAFGLSILSVGCESAKKPATIPVKTSTGPGSTTGGGTEVPAAATGGVTEKPEEKPATESKPEDKPAEEKTEAKPEEKPAEEKKPEDKPAEDKKAEEN